MISWLPPVSITHLSRLTCFGYNRCQSGTFRISSPVHNRGVRCLILKNQKIKRHRRFVSMTRNFVLDKRKDSVVEFSASTLSSVRN